MINQVNPLRLLLLSWLKPLKKKKQKQKHQQKALVTYPAVIVVHRKYLNNFKSSSKYLL